MKDHIRETLRNTGLFHSVHQFVERARVFRQLLRPRPPIPLHRDESLEPFFIVGSGRCGTTLLRRLLMAGDEIHIPPENWTLSSVLLSFRRYRWVMDWDDLVRWIVRRFNYQGTAADGTVMQWYDGHSLYDQVEKLIGLPEKERSLARVVDSLYRCHGEFQNAAFSQWGDKTPYNVGFLPLIFRVFPESKFIHMMRDGTDVVNSWLQMGQYSSIQQPASRWSGAVKMARGFIEKHPNRCLEVRYEELVREPEATVERVCNFLSIPFSSTMIDKHSHKKEMNQVAQLSHHENVFESISPVHIGKGHRTLSDEQKARIADLIGEDLRKCGYAIPE